MKHDKNIKKNTKPVRLKKAGASSEDVEKSQLENRAMREAIECNPMPYCVYDSRQRLIASNSGYRRLHPELAKMAMDAGDGVPLYYRDIVRSQLAGTVPDEDLEAQIEKRVLEQENADGRLVEREYGDNHYRVAKFKLPSGGTAGLAFDVTELKVREIELAEQKRKAEHASQQAEQALNAERLAKQNSHRMSELAEWLQSCQKLDELFRIVERFMTKMFPFCSGELYVYSNSRDVLAGACHWNSASEPHPHIEPGDCWALRRGRMLNYGSGFAEQLCDHIVEPDNIDSDQLRYVCIPIVAHGDTVGLLHMIPGQPGSENNELDTRLAIQCSEQISLAIANVKLRDELHQQSNCDSLTGLFNRRYFLNSCRTQRLASERNKSEFAIISLDADHFKNLNDVHGHDAGDTVLVALAMCIKAAAGDNGIPARLGGEEFSILFPNTQQTEAEARARALTKEISDLEIQYAGVMLPQVTVSCGVASSLEHGPAPLDILKAADVALYKAKGSGRNTVCS